MIEECFGEICPIPFLKFERIFNEIEIGENFTIIVDQSCAKVKIENHCKYKNIRFKTIEPINGIWEITVWK
ncbi:sulfurtransferase TusA family protein [Streptobacillus ratti]|uniref:sulfurtransferase TusA family protein n=1 Tax=Streptobacillus ratti TaxID=1720557 RepID=UPI0009330F15|nr:sulfurtransferase TusA family protein [Streptobacillus ratti]